MNNAIDHELPTCEIPKKKVPKKGILSAIAVVCVILAIVALQRLVPKTSAPPEDKTEVITISKLKEIIDVSELSTLKAVYNGVARVMNEEKPDEIDYYVSYNAIVTAGIDFSKVNIEIEEKTVYISMPKVGITDVSVDITSLDYIFENDKLNAPSVSAEAYRKCEEDARIESENQEKIFSLAEQSAENVLKALAKPIIEQLDDVYSLEIRRGE